MLDTIHLLDTYLIICMLWNENSIPFSFYSHLAYSFYINWDQFSKKMEIINIWEIFTLVDDLLTLIPIIFTTAKRTVKIFWGASFFFCFYSSKFQFMFFMTTILVFFYFSYKWMYPKERKSIDVLELLDRNIIFKHINNEPKVSKPKYLKTDYPWIKYRQKNGDFMFQKMMISQLKLIIKTQL